MSQHDMSIANQGFPAFRSDLNDALQALVSQNSGATAPSTTFANMVWYDTANNILKIRNEDNDAWISVLTLDQSTDAVSVVNAAAFKAVSSSGGVLQNSSGTSQLTWGAGGGDNVTIGVNTNISGNLAVDTSTLYVDATNNRVGVGTPTPSEKLQIVGTGDLKAELQTDSTNSAALRLKNASYSYILQLYSGALRIYDETNSSERMSIDSSGRVTIPNQPAFYAGAGSGTQSISNSTYTQITGLNSTKFNRGSNYDTTTSTFTAPVAGVYIFKYRVSITTGASNQITGGNDYQLKLFVNGSDYCVASSNGDYGGNPAGYFAAMTGVTICYLNANDTARVYLYQNTGSTQTVSLPMCNFSGFLVG